MFWLDMMTAHCLPLLEQDSSQVSTRPRHLLYQVAVYFIQKKTVDRRQERGKQMIVTFIGK